MNNAPLIPELCPHDAEPFDLQDGIPSDPLTVELSDKGGAPKTLDALTREIVALTYRDCNGNVSEVCRKLEIGRSTFYRWFPACNVEYHA